MTKLLINYRISVILLKTNRFKLHHFILHDAINNNYDAIERTKDFIQWKKVKKSIEKNNYYVRGIILCNITFLKLRIKKIY